jgi:hypothetical protein
MVVFEGVVADAAIPATVASKHVGRPDDRARGFAYIQGPVIVRDGYGAVDRLQLLLHLNRVKDIVESLPTRITPREVHSETHNTCTQFSSLKFGCFTQFDGNLNYPTFTFYNPTFTFIYQ